MPPRRVLVLGFGNPGRLDDGLGPAFAGSVDELNLPGVSVDADYQLNADDAAAAAEADLVVFADASVNCAEPYEFSSVQPEETISFSSHSLQPAAVMGLAASLFEGRANGYLLSIRGYEFNEFGEGLSEKAKKNLEEALKFFVSWVSAL